MLKLMAESGCYKVHYGIESGCPDVLRLMNKRVSVEEMLESMLTVKRLGMRLRALFMVCNPGETPDSVRRSIELARQAQPDELVVNIALIYPGTGLYTLAKQHGLIDDSYWLKCDRLPMYPAMRQMAAERWFGQLRFCNHRFGGLMTGLYVLKTLVRRVLGLLVTAKGLHSVPRVPPLFDQGLARDLHPLEQPPQAAEGVAAPQPALQEAPDLGVYQPDAQPARQRAN